LTSPHAAASAPTPSVREESAQAVKHFVLDTNVLLHNPDALFVFKENNVVVPFAVIEELDQFKKGNDDLARNARACIRHLDRLRRMGRIVEGVRWGRNGEQDQTGLIRIDVDDHPRPHAISADTPDNRILAVAVALREAGCAVVFISKDINARIKADALGVAAEDFEAQKVDPDRLYTGHIELTAPGALIDELYTERMLELDRLFAEVSPAQEEASPVEEAPPLALDANQFALLRDAADPSHTGLARRLADTSHVIPVLSQRKPTFGVMARNIHQTMALDLLLDDDVKLVTLTGGAGTGKTLLALAAGMHKVFKEEVYDRLLVARPVVPMGRDIGYLPGEKEEKLSAWMQPIFDNLELLLQTRGSTMQQAESRSPEQRLERLLEQGQVVLEALTYIRGRTIPNQFMIVDEAQNLTPHEVKTIVSRVGEGTKLVLTGDIMQIDNPYLDASSNGLSYCVERMRGLGPVGHITLEKSERSELASLAAERL